MVVAAKLIDMPGIKRTPRIAGEMAFEVEQAQLQRPVQEESQSFEPLKAIALRVAQSRWLHPQDFVTTDLRTPAAACAAPHRSIMEFPALLQCPAFAKECGGQRRPEKIIDHHPALQRKAVGNSV